MAVGSNGPSRASSALHERKYSKKSNENASEKNSRLALSTKSESPSFSKNVKVTLFAALLYCPLIALFFVIDLESEKERYSISINFGMSVVAFFMTVQLIPAVVPYVLRKNMYGFDINKRGSPAGEVKVPESQGLVVAIVFLVTAILFQHFYFTPDSAWLVEYNAALACICFMAFLGFIDDVLDIPWRVKLILPTIASLPLLMAYSGGTSILVPKPFRSLLSLILGSERGGEVIADGVLDLGVLYLVYIVLLSVFCSNSINILAGINGLEAGQTAIISASVLIFNLFQIGGVHGIKSPLHQEMRQAHLFSIYLTQPLLATTLGLLVHNWYPSSVFVGDTFTYFTGMTFAVVGILGHFSETLLLLFLPQVLNFLYSLPQLFKIVHCPRHRLPKFDPATGLLHGSNDLNLVNLFLRVFGPCTEQTLLLRLLSFQVLSSFLCFGVRFLLTGVYK